MVGWHYSLSGDGFEETVGDSGRQKSLACCSPWGHKESDRTLQLNNNNFKYEYGGKTEYQLQKCIKSQTLPILKFCAVLSRSVRSDSL